MNIRRWCRFLTGSTAWVNQRDALGNETNYEYDEFNRQKKVIYPAITSGGTRLDQRTEYDLVGNVKKRIDTAGRQTIYEYDNANRLISTTDAMAQVTHFEYNARSQMVKVTDALNQQYVFTFDPLGRQLSQTRAGATMSFEYDAVGNRTNRTDYSGRETTYEYDVLNRLKKINYFPGTTNPVPALTATYNYDDLSRLTSAGNENGTVNFTYDTRGRVKTSTDVFGHLVEYDYDAASNRTQLKLDSAVHTTYNYDGVNRLTQLTDEASQNFTFGYDIANRLTSTTLPNGVTTTFDYDGMSRLTRLKDAASTATLFDRQYQFDPANQITQITEPSQTRNLGVRRTRCD
ncbi:MAG: RHS repeat protein [Acidobacteria bacterium]|nr:RHS repeat protein [Acidobacteriota bacterium]